MSLGVYLDPASTPPTLVDALYGFLALLDHKNNDIPGQPPFREVLRSVEAWLGEEGRTANKLAHLTWLIPWEPPQRSRALDVAVAFCLEADAAYSRGQPETSWAALAQAHYYLGLASGPLTASERQAASASAKFEKEWGEHVRFVVQWLSEKAPLQFADRSEAIAAIVDEYYAAFPDAIGDLNDRLSSWARERDEVALAFARVCRRQPQARSAADGT